MWPTPNALGVYVHFPWCVQKCPYCDFNSHPLRGSLDEDAYLQALLEDLGAQLRDLSCLERERGAPRIDSVFFGGGTPSLFAADTFASLLAELAPWLTADVEVTMEANPGTVEHYPWKDYRKAGINRLSLGAQSFAPGALRKLGRIHGPDEIGVAFRAAREAGFDNINLDMMYALPEQSAAEALADLEAALALSPDHVSWYQLTLEPKTEFHARPPTLPDEDAVIDMEAHGRELLVAAGFTRYEISAYARPGRMARHNLNYWTFGDYLGVGAGAHGKQTIGSRTLRTEKPRQPRLYMAQPSAMPVREIGADAIAGEFLLNALRLVDGVSFSEFEARTGLSKEALQPLWQRFVELGLLRADRLATTARGLNYLDSLLAEFVSA